MNCQQTLHERRQPPVRLAPGEVPAHPVVGIGEIIHARADLRAYGMVAQIP